MSRSDRRLRVSRRRPPARRSCPHAACDERGPNSRRGQRRRVPRAAPGRRQAWCASRCRPSTGLWQCAAPAHRHPRGSPRLDQRQQHPPGTDEPAHPVEVARIASGCIISLSTTPVRRASAASRVKVASGPDGAQGRGMGDVAQVAERHVFKRRGDPGPRTSPVRFSDSSERRCKTRQRSRRENRGLCFVIQRPCRNTRPGPDPGPRRGGGGGGPGSRPGRAGSGWRAHGKGPLV